MKYELERKIKLITDVEHDSLYKWALQEYDELGNKIGSPQIPWKWGVNFKAEKLIYSRKIQIGESELSISSTRKPKKANKKAKLDVSDNETIYGEMEIGDFRWGEWQKDICKLSMFGKNVNIGRIALEIHPSASNEEICCLSGFLGSLDDQDMEYVQEDTLFVTVYLCSDRFNQIAQLVRDNIKDCTVRLSAVSGFYSSWCPGIHTNQIKVLCNDKEQEVEVPDNCDIKPSRLGELKKFSLIVNSSDSQKFDKSANCDKNGNTHYYQKVLSKIQVLMWVLILFSGFILLNLGT